jgi:hypothetical protein
MTDTPHKNPESCTGSDTPETDAYRWNDDRSICGWGQFAEKLERERDSWKAAHDNQVKLKQIISNRPDLKERAKLVAELIKERDEALDNNYQITKMALEFRRELCAIKDVNNTRTPEK